MKEKRITKWHDIWDEFSYCLRMLCGRPSPLKRFIIVLIAGVALGAGGIYTLVSSIYNAGKSDTERMYIEHIRFPELKNRKDSINLLKQYRYEYRQSGE
jgi:hypothetical protein